MKVCFETFGCRLNRAEALAEEARYLARGWERTESHSDAQLIVVRGCSVTARAQKDCERLIDHIKAKYPFKRVIVTGCLPKADKGYFLKDVRRDASAPAEDPVPVRTARAYLKVQDGCAGKCSFCIVPSFRGSSTSVPWDKTLDTAKRFIDAGYRELVVTGCNLVQYVSQGKRFPDLVAALAGLSPSCRIRLGSVEPGPVALETVDAMAGNANVCRFLHIPVQSGSGRILAAMRRPYTIRTIDELVQAAVKAMPHLGLGVDLMTGFPGETDNDQLATLSLMRRHPLTKAHVFPFSERPGTVAATLPDAVPPAIRSARAHELAALADEKRTLFAKRFRGREVEVVVEDEKSIAGWTAEYLWCRVGEEKDLAFTGSRSSRDIRRKDLVTIRVREAKGHVLSGKLTQWPAKR
ncbi:MAG: radical SAM protein [Kiritimatiellae bacterium]|nr:radical SAM protein [Kiritimatiellia bacterium]